jgi:large subunit ribosomal protein L18
MKVKSVADYRRRRHLRVRRKVQGTAERPRMSVFVSNRHLYVQFIDDEAAQTLASASTAGKVAADKKNDKAVAAALGKQAAEAAKAKGIERVVFDRGGFSFEGRIKILADAAREGGLVF